MHVASFFDGFGIFNLNLLMTLLVAPWLVFLAALPIYIFYENATEKKKLVAKRSIILVAVYFSLYFFWKLAKNQPLFIWENF